MKPLLTLSIAAALSSLSPWAPAQVELDQVDQLSPTGGAANDFFGLAADLDGSTAMFGAPNRSPGGAVVVFHEQAGVWSELTTLAPGGAQAGDQFGASVALEGTRALVGASSFDDTLADQGAAFVYRRVAGVWTEQQRLVAGDPDSGQAFGTAVALDGTVALVAAAGDVQPAGIVGAVYVFRHNGTSWVQSQKLLPSSPAGGLLFGSAVALDNGVAVIAAQGDTSAGAFTGSVYVFRDDGTSFVEAQILTASDAAADALFGQSLALDQGTLLVGSATDDLAADAGSVYVFRDDGSAFREEVRLDPFDPTSDGGFGRSVELQDGWALIGRNDVAGGAAHVFRDGSTGWVQGPKLVATDGVPADGLGIAVALDAGRAMTCAPLANGGIGKAYLHTLPDLALDATADVVTAFDPLALRTSMGLPGGLAMIAAVAVDGTPLFVKVGLGSFNGNGTYAVGGGVPPGLGSLTVDFLAFGHDVDGRIAGSNVHMVEFQ